MGIEKVSLGGSGIKVTRLGMGCWAVGGHGWGETCDKDSLIAIKRAFDSGCSFFDTADVYGFGHSEKLLRMALGEDRHRAVIATKGGVRWDVSGKIWKDCSSVYLRRAVDESRLRLELDTIPLYYIHWPDKITPVSDAVETMALLREQKKINAIGVSNFSLEQLHEASRITRIDAIQFKFSVIHRTGSEEILAFCREKAITPVFYGALADGLLTDKFNEHSKFDVDDHRSRMPEFQGEQFLSNLKVVEDIRAIGERVGASTGQLALRWLLDATQESVALFGAKTEKQVEENLSALTLSLTEKDVEFITNLNR